MSEIITFPGSPPKRAKAMDDDHPPRHYSKRRHKRPLFTKSDLNMREAAFRGYDAIEEATPEELVRDVGMDLHKAQLKLKKAQARVQSLRDDLDKMTYVETKLSAAIVEALLSGKREG
jgi:hypothetical protein